MNRPNRAPRCVSRSAWKPSDGRPVSKFVIPERKIDDASRTITFTISTAARDRDGDIIDQAGWDLEDYRKNPVILWAHEGWSPPVARAESVAVENGRLISVARFPTREQYAFADTVYQLYKGGFLNATSVGFVPDEMDLMEGGGAGEIGFRFLRQRLLEYSAVPIPSNPEALVVARSAHIDVSPCEDWIERMLDDRAAGTASDLLNRTYIALKGKLHPVFQNAIGEANARALADRENKMPENDDDDKPVMTTGAGGEDGHTHQFRSGDPQTEPGGDDGHVHAVTYAEDGAITIEAAEGHGHDAPASKQDRNGDVDSEDEVSVQTPVNNPLDQDHHGQPENQRGAEAPAVKEVTDWPQPGMSFPVSLLTSEYRVFPAAEALALKEDWPEIWARGAGPGDISGADAIRARESWAARHVDDFDLAGVVSQVRHLVRGSRGIDHMRQALSHAKQAVMDDRDKAKGLSPAEIGAITDRVVQRAVVPTIERVLRKYSGRVS